MTTASHELALYVINTAPGDDDCGSTYEERCELASRRSSSYESYVAPLRWIGIATLGAQAYSAEFGGTAYWSDIFGAEDILACAAELVGYYREHVKEIAAV